MTFFKVTKELIERLEDIVKFNATVTIELIQEPYQAPIARVTFFGEPTGHPTPLNYVNEVPVHYGLSENALCQVAKSAHHSFISLLSQGA